MSLLADAEGALGQLAAVGRLVPNPDLLIRPYLLREAVSSTRIEGTQATIGEVLDADATGVAASGRLGRLLLVFFLVARERLPAPLLYLSAYLEQNRASYYESLQALRARGDPIPWVNLFLTAVQTQASDAVMRAERIVDLHESYRVAASTLGTPNALLLVDLICENPVLTTRSVEDSLKVSRPTAIRLLRRMEEQGVLIEQKAGARRQRRYVAQALMDAVAG